MKICKLAIRVQTATAKLRIIKIIKECDYEKKRIHEKRENVRTVLMKRTLPLTLFIGPVSNLAYVVFFIY